MKIKSKSLPYLLLLPTLIWVFSLIVYPFLSAAHLSFYSSKYGVTLGEFVGLKNFYKLLFEDDMFWIAFKNSMVWTVGNLVIQTVFGLGGALLLNEKFRARNASRTLVIIPWVIPTVVISLIWRWMLEPSMGIVNAILSWTGIMSPDEPFLYLGSLSYAMLVMIIINSWRFTPFAIVLILAALQTIPLELYESSDIDGASGFQKFRNITFPLISPILGFVGLFAFVWTFNLFDLIWLTTHGGPANATETLPLLIYRRGFAEFRTSEAAAISVIMFLFLAVFSIVYFKRIVRRAE